MSYNLMHFDINIAFDVKLFNVYDTNIILPELVLYHGHPVYD